MQEKDSREELNEEAAATDRQPDDAAQADQESLLGEGIPVGDAAAEAAEQAQSKDETEAQAPESMEAALAELQQWKDQALRAMADVENVRQRSQRDVEKARKFALEKFAQELLPVVDSLEQALVAANPDDEQVKPMLEGIRLTHKLFLDTLARFNVEVLDPHGEPFDPQFHEAMSMVEAPDCEPSTVVQVFQKGFVLNGRVIRAAKVVVSKAAAGQKIDEQA